MVTDTLLSSSDVSVSSISSSVSSSADIFFLDLELIKMKYFDI